MNKDEWVITVSNDLKHTGTNYLIPADRLTEEDWILHLMEKRWFDLNTFIPAYFEALRRAGHKSVEVATTYSIL